MGKVIDFTAYQRAFGQDEDEMSLPPEGNDEEIMREVLLFIMGKKLPRLVVIRLHLELIPEGNPIMQYPVNEKERTRLLTLAKAQKGITRDILVPGDMNLHALHYAITKLFGWQNEHLHRFCLEADLFEQLTDGRVGGYEELCGVLFRANNEADSDLFWDDDYQEGSNFDRWRKRKYSRPFRDYALTDTWYMACQDAELIRGRYPEVRDEDRIDEVDRYFQYNLCKELLESLTVEDLFTTAGCSGWREDDFAEWQEDIAFQKEELPDWLQFFNYGEEPDSEDSLEGMTLQLMHCRENLRNLESGIYRDKVTQTRDYHKLIKKQTGDTAENLLADFRREEEYLTEECRMLFELLKVRPEPFTNTLLYNYDFGDDWWVRITAESIYTLKAESEEVTNAILQAIYRDEAGGAGDESPDLGIFSDGQGTFLDQNGEIPDDETSRRLMQVLETGKPECVAADGLNLVEDVGGIGGYLDFLETLKRGTSEEKEEMRTWAKSLGWTGRKKKPENML